MDLMQDLVVQRWTSWWLEADLTWKPPQEGFIGQAMVYDLIHKLRG
jgi:hypothetical protein